MILIRPLFVLLFVLFACEIGAQVVSNKTPMAESGETVLVGRSSQFEVRVSIRMHPVEKKTEHMLEPGGYVPRSHVERIEILVNGNKIFVGRSVFCDLFDLHSAQVQLGEKVGVLTFEGGDASESYWAKIEFDAKLVKRRSLGSGMDPKATGEAAQVTTYHLRVFKDE